ncbi:MAG: PPC domain-containing protein, partial [Saprospiraceae bacterium]
MKNCLHTFTKWIFCLLAMVAINDLTAQNVRDGFCDYAIDASCGVAITNQTNKGGTNVIWDYQCNDYTFSGPEKVYKFTTTDAGTLQIDLSIKEADTDLDILLLSNDCNTPTCLAQAITSNANGKTEQIIYNNAPAGTYYVIVDSEVHVGTYDLLITCTPSSACNLEYTATPNHISCGASKGSIDIAIAWGKAPFTIAWDNADNSIWNTYTTSDKNYKIDNLPAGVYTVKVTDAMGCELMKNNIALTNSGTSLAATFSATPAPCGSNFGWINIDVANSSPPYWVTVTGPRAGTVQGTSDNIVIKDMPPGNYEVTVEKGGCTKEGWVTVTSTPN